MELDNESAGTPVTELGIHPGDQRLYQFRLYRPGNYWFHPGVLPLLTVSRGVIGRLIIRTHEENLLTQAGVLLLNYRAITLSDSAVANAINKTKYRNTMIFPGFTQEEVDNNLMPNIEPTRPATVCACGTPPETASSRKASWSSPTVTFHQRRRHRDDLRPGRPGCPSHLYDSH